MFEQDRFSLPEWANKPFRLMPDELQKPHTGDLCHLKRILRGQILRQNGRQAAYREYNHPVFQMLLRSGYDAKSIAKITRRLQKGCLRAFKNRIRRKSLNTTMSFKEWSSEVPIRAVLQTMDDWMAELTR